MFYGGGMWGYFAQSCLDTLFAKADFRVEELLDEDNIINDVKMNQSKFADFMTANPQHLRTLVRYAISLPLETDDDKHQRKYPFVASELLGIQIPKLQEFFFSQKPQTSLIEEQKITIVEKEDTQPERQAEPIEKVEEKQEIVESEKQTVDKKEENLEQIENASTQPEKQEPAEQKVEIELKQKNEDQEAATETAEDANQKESAQKTTESVAQVDSSESTKADETLNTVQESVAANTTTADAAETTTTLVNTAETDSNQESNKEQSKPTELEQVIAEHIEVSSEVPIVHVVPPVEEEKKDIQEAEEPTNDTVEAAPNSQIIYGEDLLNELFAFIKPHEELNSTSTGYFCKIALQLINAREGKLLKYLGNNPEVMDNLLYHFLLKSISKVVLAIISQDGTEVDPDPFLAERMLLVKKLYEKIDTCTDHEVLINVQETLVAINEAALKPQNFELKRSLFSQEHIDILVNAIEQHKESFSQAALILSSYLDHYRQTLYNEPAEEESESRFNESLNFGKKNEEIIAKEFPLAYLQSKMSNLIKALMEEKLNQEVPSHETQYGSRVQPFGLNRVKLLHLILCLLKTENTVVCDALVESDFFTYLLNLIIKHEWNNILHNQIEQIIIESFKIAIKDVRVRDAIVVKAGFLSFLANNCMNLQTVPGTSRKPINKGYICFLVNFANQIEEQRTQLEWLKEAVEQTPNWEELVKGSLKQINGLQNRDLGNEDPRKRKESEEAIQNNDLSIKEIYMKFISMYQSNKAESASTEEADKAKEEEEEQEESEPKEDTGDTPEKAGETEIQETIRLAKEREFEACNYWKMDIKYDIDSLAKDL